MFLLEQQQDFETFRRYEKYHNDCNYANGFEKFATIVEPRVFLPIDQTCAKDERAYAGFFISSRNVATLSGDDFALGRIKPDTLRTLAETPAARDHLIYLNLVAGLTDETPQ
jgi:hypothetical protein